MLWVVDSPFWPLFPTFFNKIITQLTSGAKCKDTCSPKCCILPIVNCRLLLINPVDSRQGQLTMLLPSVAYCNILSTYLLPHRGKPSIGCLSTNQFQWTVDNG